MEACESFPSGLPESLDPLTFIVRTGLKRIKPSIRHGTHNKEGTLPEDSKPEGYAY